jgi:hypothetical protein
MRFGLCSLIVVSGVACSNGSDGNKCSDYEPPGGFDAQNPKVSFSKDVVPIFGQSCAFSACHGGVGNPNGVHLPQGDGATIHKNIVDVRSSKLPSMPFVKPGDPRQSFLMRKLDKSQCVLDAQCGASTCGASMPKDDDLLPIEERDKIRRWIAQGAKND